MIEEDEAIQTRAHTVSGAWAAADEAGDVAEGPLSTNDPGLMYAMLALRWELRALALILEERSR